MFKLTCDKYTRLWLQVQPWAVHLKSCVRSLKVLTSVQLALLLLLDALYDLGYIFINTFKCKYICKDCIRYSLPFCPQIFR